jgi:hypothetical protein
MLPENFLGRVTIGGCRTGIHRSMGRLMPFAMRGGSAAIATLLWLRRLLPAGFGTVVVGESRNFQGGMEWLRSLGVRVLDLDSAECVSMLGEYIRKNPDVWNEDIGEE